MIEPSSLGEKTKAGHIISPASPVFRVSNKNHARICNKDVALIRMHPGAPTILSLTPTMVASEDPIRSLAGELALHYSLGVDF